MNGIKKRSNELRETIGDTFQSAIKGQMVFVFFIVQKVNYTGETDIRELESTFGAFSVFAYADCGVFSSLKNGIAKL